MTSAVRFVLVTIHMYRRCDTPVKRQLSDIPTAAVHLYRFPVPEDTDRAEMQRLLAYANYSKVAEAIGVKRAAVSQWAAGRHVTPKRLEQVRELMGTTKEAAPPNVEERLNEVLAYVRVIAGEAEGVTPEKVQRMRRLVDQLTQSRQQPDEAHLSEDRDAPGRQSNTGR